MRKSIPMFSNFSCWLHRWWNLRGFCYCYVRLLYVHLPCYEWTPHRAPSTSTGTCPSDWISHSHRQRPLLKLGIPATTTLWPATTLWPRPLLELTKVVIILKIMFPNLLIIFTIVSLVSAKGSHSSHSSHSSGSHTRSSTTHSSTSTYTTPVSY